MVDDHQCWKICHLWQPGLLTLLQLDNHWLLLHAASEPPCSCPLSCYGLSEAEIPLADLREEGRVQPWPWLQAEVHYISHWPLVMWMVEMFLDAIGMELVSIWSCMSFGQCTNAVNDFTSTENTCQALVTTFNCSSMGLNLHDQCSTTALTSTWRDG